MTYQALFNEGTEQLQKHGVEDPDFDALQLLLKAASFTTNEYYTHKEKEAKNRQIDRYRGYLEERIFGRPLQYILGEWDFYGYTFQVGEGVLIPRPETELLVDQTVEYIRNQPNWDKRYWHILDLCAGTGCIGISVMNQLPNMVCTFVEKSDEAYSFLERNIEQHDLKKRAILIKGDIKDGYRALGVKTADILLSNPPYVKTEELESLQAEVGKEPVMALDGGKDGLDFYHVLAKRWLPFLPYSAFIGLEGGEDQAQQIASLLSYQVEEVSTAADAFGVERFVFAVK